MPVVNGVITAPFNTWTVAKTIGMSTGDIGTLVSKATDGTNAFDASGVLIANKGTYWNMFTGWMPGSWYRNSNDYVIRLKLNPAPGNVLPWAYNLHDFERYNHNTSKPEVAIFLRSSAGASELTIRMDLGKGVKWREIIESISDFDLTGVSYGIGCEFIVSGAGEITVYGEESTYPEDTYFTLGYMRTPSFLQNIDLTLFLFQKNSKGGIRKWYIQDNPTIKQNYRVINEWIPTPPPDFIEIPYYGYGLNLYSAKKSADMNGYDTPMSSIFLHQKTQKYYKSELQQDSNLAFDAFYVTGYEEFYIGEDKYAWFQTRSGSMIDSNIYTPPYL